MGLLDELEQHFGNRDLYAVLGIGRDATEAQLKKAYRHQSLKHHPDKFVGGEQQANASKIQLQTTRFQLLGRVHKLLSDTEKRALYDSNGLVLDDLDGDGLNSDRDWTEYWRLLFPKVTVEDIERFMRKYTGSDEERDDLIHAYNKAEGDLDVICETMIGYEEARHRQMLLELIEAGQVQAFDKFTNEPAKKTERRRKKLEKEAKLFEREQEKKKKQSSKKRKENDAEDDEDAGSDDKEDEDPQMDLIRAIRGNADRRKQGFDSMIASLEARYAQPKSSRPKKKSK